MIGDLLKIKLRNGTDYSSTGVVEFLQPLLDEFLTDYPKLPLLLRGDSVLPNRSFMSNVKQMAPMLSAWKKSTLRALASGIDERLTEAAKTDMVFYTVCYGEFLYQAGSWKYPRHIVCKVEKPTDQLIHMYTFIVTNMDSAPGDLIRFYCKKGSLKNYIKESKNGFDFTSVSSSSKIVNANRLQVHALAYNIFNWFKQLVLPAKCESNR